MLEDKIPPCVVEAPSEEPEAEETSMVCPLCNSGEFLKRLLFFTYCANPAHVRKQDEPLLNTVLEFRTCVEHGVHDDCIKTVCE